MYNKYWNITCKPKRCRTALTLCMRVHSHAFFKWHGWSQQRDPTSARPWSGGNCLMNELYVISQSKSIKFQKLLQWDSFFSLPALFDELIHLTQQVSLGLKWTLTRSIFRTGHAIVRSHNANWHSRRNPWPNMHSLIIYPTRPALFSPPCVKRKLPLYLL